MFSEKELDAYKSIQAPNTLHCKIQEASRQQKHAMRLPPMGLMAAAACLVLILGLMGFFPRQGAPEIVLNGQTLEDSVFFYDISPASELRSSPVFSVPLELTLPDETVLSVSYGQMLTDGSAPAKTLTAKGSLALWWEFPRGEELPTLEMSLNSQGKQTLITLTYDPAEKTITATKTKN